jgi:hypothetical protein
MFLLHLAGSVRFLPPPACPSRGGLSPAAPPAWRVAGPRSHRSFHRKDSGRSEHCGRPTALGLVQKQPGLVVSREGLVARPGNRGRLGEQGPPLWPPSALGSLAGTAAPGSRISEELPKNSGWDWTVPGPLMVHGVGEGGAAGGARRDSRVQPGLWPGEFCVQVPSCEPEPHPRSGGCALGKVLTSVAQFPLREMGLRRG